MNITRLYALICAFLMTIDFTYGEQLSNYFKYLERAAILGEPFDRADGYESLVECVVQCPLTSGCYAVTYSFEEKACYFYNWENISLEVASGMTQCTLIVNTGILMFHVTGRPLLTFEEAGELCQEYGGRLASVSDMYDARDKGYDLCRCGWVSDGSIRFVIQEQRQGCESHSSGVISCKNAVSTTDVYCAFV